MTAPPPPPGPPRPPHRPLPEPPDLPPWRPVAWRQRGLLILLALATAIVLGWLMLQPKLALMGARAARGEAPVPIGLPTEAHRAARAARAVPAASEAPSCAERTVPGCVGGKMDVLVLPPAASR